MMRLAEIELHLGSIGELLDVVGAMRSLASMRVQEALRALPGIRRYADAMANAIGSALLLLPEMTVAGRGKDGHRALILCTAEHGFVGGFNESIMAAARADVDPRDALFILGSRGAALAHELNWSQAWTHPMATRPESVPEMVRRLTAELYRRIARGSITRVEVMFAHYRRGGAATIERHRLLPLDLASFATERGRLPPLHNLAPQALIEKLAAEYIFALLTEAGTESIASENAARFSAMESAHDNVSKKLAQLQQDARQARQNEITTELIDLVTGAEALS
ncbi:MAG TPA: FoF1 ATP synthase subunit gamma [Stellaceae bacterium]|nr:FoF1 ATP synthase subunit gamma [Stellaceae bacterium]